MISTLNQKIGIQVAFILAIHLSVVIGHKRKASKFIDDGQWEFANRARTHTHPTLSNSTSNDINGITVAQLYQSNMCLQ